MTVILEPTFRNELMACGQIFDFFAVGYDHLDLYLQLPPTETNVPMLNMARVDASNWGLVERMRLAGGAIPPVVWNYLALPLSSEECQTSQEFLLRLYFTLVAIDDASEEINVFKSTPRDDNPLSAALSWFEGYRKLNTDSTLGKVLFRAPTLPGEGDSWAVRSVALGERGELRYRGQHLSRNFENLCRVRAVEGCEFDYEVIPPSRDIILPRPLTQLVIGVVPLVDTLSVGPAECSLNPGPLKIRVLEKDTQTCAYTVDGDGEGISPVRADSVCVRLAERAEAAVRRLQAEGAQIAVFPELVVPDAVLRRIKQVLADTIRERASLQVVVAGSYSRGRGNNGLPYNEAIVLNGRGEELWRQRKLHHYEMHPYEQKRFGLYKYFGGLYAREAVATHPRTLTVRDSSLGRLAVLICEDIAQPIPGFHNLTALQVNYVFSPVMAGALEASRSFARQAERLTIDAGAVCVVANSMPLAKAEWGEKPGFPPLGIVSLPLQDIRKNPPSLVTVLQEPIWLPDPPGGSVLLFRCPA